MLRTKIVCTLGPVSGDLETIRAFAQAGMAVARINFSHGTYEDHARRIALVREVARENRCPIAVLADLQGPKLRVGLLPGHQVALAEGEMVRLRNEESTEEPGVIPVPHPEVLRDVRVGDRILMDDGLLELLVTEGAQEQVLARVVTGGLLSSRKGVSLPHTGLAMPSITDKDRADAAFAVEQDVDYFALSFVRCAEDVELLRRYLQEELGARTPIIAKIEKPEAVDCIESIIAVSDGIMVARGDLGIEAPAEEVPIIQKRIIKLANQASLPVITATQMLDSMIRNPRPTRAEASDVANAILDGSDAIMLSGETAVGRYATMAVRTMARIAEVTERSLPYQEWLRRTFDSSARDVTEAISQIAAEIAAELGARAIMASTMNGSTAQRVASHRPSTPILAPTPREDTYRQLALVWGVVPIWVDAFADTEAMIVTVVDAARERGLVDDGDLVIITAGVPLGGAGLTNTLKAHRVGEERGWR
ncbi:MAG: pyruvate kinase [Anaerolineae bacterium]|nr:pyruvate kinase [Anaerolineae bacterium]